MPTGSKECKRLSDATEDVTSDGSWIDVHELTTAKTNEDYLMETYDNMAISNDKNQNYYINQIAGTFNKIMVWTGSPSSLDKCAA